jgi:predicted PurR-regulated permease PerM
MRMLWAFQGVAVLLLLSVFFAYMLAPVVAGLGCRIRIGPRKRPVSRAVILSVLYALLFVPGMLAWRLGGDRMTRWVGETAPATVDRLFGGVDFDAIERLIARAPLISGAGGGLRQGLESAIGYLEREVRETLGDLISAAEYAAWLAVAPILAFLLLTAAPGFRRSALRVLPHGHLQWRGEEYLRDVNSALAGYVRAQAGAGVIVGLACMGGFALLGIPSAVPMGVAAGMLELVPAVGPLTAMLMAATQAGDRVLAVILFLGALRVIQDYVIYPRLVRRGTRMSTPTVILTVWCGAVVAGAAGVIVAVPIAAFLSVSLRHWREYRDIERLVRMAADGTPRTEPRNF